MGVWKKTCNIICKDTDESLRGSVAVRRASKVRVRLETGKSECNIVEVTINITCRFKFGVFKVYCVKWKVLTVAAMRYLLPLRFESFTLAKCFRDEGPHKDLPSKSLAVAGRRVVERL